MRLMAAGSRRSRNKRPPGLLRDDGAETRNLFPLLGRILAEVLLDVAGPWQSLFNKGLNPRLSAVDAARYLSGLCEG
jgi:hypothetical protein